MPAQRKRTKRGRPDPDYFRAQREAQVRARRAVCSLLLFWRSCGHKPCLRARACARESNDCFSRFWPLVPEQIKISIHAGLEARAAGHSEPEIAAAIARAEMRWRATQPPPQAPPQGPGPVLPLAEGAAAPHRVVVPPARAQPRVRML